MQNKFALTTIAATLSIALAGCGGGGSDSPASTPVANTPAPVVPTPMPTPTPLVLTATTQAAVAPTYMVNSQERRAFDALATFRNALNLGPVNQNAKVDLAAKAHSDYVATNNGGATPHDEVVGKPGFTGVTVKDRLVTAGYAATDAAEVMGWTSANADAAEVIEGLAATVYHRVIMMNQGWTDLGIAPPVVSADINATRPSFIDFGTLTLRQNVAGNYVGVYPANNQTAIGLTHAPEAPNPFVDVDGTAGSFCAKTSYPISLMVQQSTKLAVTSFTVTEEGQITPVEVRLLTSETDKTGLLPQYVAFIVGKLPFKASTRYNVKFTGTATGSATGATNGVMSIDKSWSFTTAAKDYRCQG
ncbi:CAP domain-containing protein [Massilia jejuensis]|uniref:CAP domain-containing protein n=1 Tax=Massilia jejuensis TaxID=648894 RepID=A0ABW0PGJ5_9BURK